MPSARSRAAGECWSHPKLSGASLILEEVALAASGAVWSFYWVLLLAPPFTLLTAGLRRDLGLHAWLKGHDALVSTASQD